MPRAHLIPGWIRDAQPSLESLKESLSFIETLSSLSSWKIRDRVGCTYPYLQVRSTFEPNSYNSEVD